MSGGDPRKLFLYELPPSVFWEFCRVMDGLTDLDWTRFASEVLHDQTAVRLAVRKEKRTDWVMNQWENRNGRVGELVHLLECLQLFRPCDVILGWVSSLKPSPSSLPPPPPPVSLSQFDPPPKCCEASSTLSTCRLSMLSNTHEDRGGRPLPRPAPPPSSLQSDLHQPPQPPPIVACGGGVMCWSYEEVHAGTKGFSPLLQVGEGGFGVVYRATLRNTDCAVKKLKQDCLLDWTLLKESFQTEVDKLSKFRHPNIVDLLGFSEGGGSVCLIYSYMDNKSLEDQLHNECADLSWSQRVFIVEGASAALQFLHSPPDGHMPLIHGDVKSSNILLDHHWVAKLADFGLARFASHRSARGGRSVAQTASVGKTATIRGTLAYLPDEYVRNGELGTAVDVYSFGVVLLEVLTGRRALDNDSKSKERYLKDLVEEIEDRPTGSSAAAWRKELDQRLITGGAPDPTGCLEMVALACRCLDRKRKKRPAMTEVFDQLQDIHKMVRKASSSSSSSSPIRYSPHRQAQFQSFPKSPHSLDRSVRALSNQLSKLGPLEDTYQVSQSSSSFSLITPPHPLNSSSLLSSSFDGPCETDESRGFSQYKLRSQLGCNGTSSRSLSLSNRDQHHFPEGPAESQFSQPSVPTEDQYNFPLQPCNTSDRPVGPARADSQGQTTAGLYGLPECLSPAGSLQSLSLETPVHINPSKQRFLEKKTLYEEGRIRTPELLSSHDLYGGRASVGSRGPEESDELDYIPAKHK
ncbi:interleukin-1 receptor-associated kinase 1 isoform X2 [Mastacembelus armatus]|uniref:Interleukin-1 receptor-associated kinase 1 n=1 Tax=Mastacembelus armatus TaxID=205130 RepID=A0A3Q3LST6_9TELE|nr:interleukin-1 receptor-associated kinase 1-like isoform X2 [Mastacembelus armatus]